ncbi:hypothetical protein [Streptomyces sp. 7N604]|uniref:hypothetical protein n=1 Tax=Streptomyces sp. 7N604 TaxID=3457415 RepID=UPI003FD625D9
MEAEPTPSETRAQASRRQEAEANRRATEEGRAQAERTRAQRLTEEKKRWDELVAACPVPVTVRKNLSGGSRIRDGANVGALTHVVPETDVVSGKSRQHLAGRALRPSRTRPQRLGEVRFVSDPPKGRRNDDHA